MTIEAAARGLENVVTTTVDLDEFGFEGLTADGAWIRWVLAFVRQPRRVLSKLATAMRSGSRIVIHEYPIADLVRPSDPRWAWPTMFALSGINRLVNLGDCSAAEGEQKLAFPYRASEQRAEARTSKALG